MNLIGMLVILGLTGYFVLRHLSFGRAEAFAFGVYFLPLSYFFRSDPVTAGICLVTFSMFITGMYAYVDEPRKKYWSLFAQLFLIGWGVFYGFWVLVGIGAAAFIATCFKKPSPRPVEPTPQQVEDAEKEFFDMLRRNDMW